MVFNFVNIQLCAQTTGFLPNHIPPQSHESHEHSFIPQMNPNNLKNVLAALIPGEYKYTTTKFFGDVNGELREPKRRGGADWKRLCYSFSL